MLFRAVLLAGILLMAAAVLLRPKRLGTGWSLDVGFADQATRIERILFITGAALALLALAALR